MAGETTDDLAKMWLESQIDSSGQPRSRPVPPTTLSATASAMLSGTVVALRDKTQLGAPGSKRVHGYNIHNPNAAPAYVQLFNAASSAAVTIGTTAPLAWLAVPAGGVLDGFWPNSFDFSAGLVVAATTTPNGATLVTTGLPVTLGFVS